LDLIENKIRRLSFNQLRALAYLCQSKGALISSSPTGRKMGVVGKSLGGVFSSLSRQRIRNQPLLIPFGRGDEGRGLRWKLNISLVSTDNLAKIVSELLESWGNR